MIFQFFKKKAKKTHTHKAKQNKNDKMIFSLSWNTMFAGYWKVLVLDFWDMENTAFSEPKRWWNDDIYLDFLSFPRYSRAWEI